MNWINPISSIYNLFFGSPFEQIAAVPHVVEAALKCKDVLDRSGDKNTLETVLRRDCGGLAYMPPKEETAFQDEVSNAIHRLRKTNNPQVSYYENHFARCFVKKQFEDRFEHLDAPMQELTPILVLPEKQRSWNCYKALYRTDIWAQEHRHLLQQWNKPNWVACFKDSVCATNYNASIQQYPSSMHINRRYYEP